MESFNSKELEHDLVHPRAIIDSRTNRDVVFIAFDTFAASSCSPIETLVSIDGSNHLAIVSILIISWRKADPQWESFVARCVEELSHAALNGEARRLFVIIINKSSPDSASIL